MVQMTASAPESDDRKPTESLTQVGSGQLSQLDIFLLAKEGFALQDVRAMVSISKLYTSSKVMDRILGKSKPKKTDDGTTRLNISQSAIAFQFAKVLEQAATVFGSLPLAEEWLQKPCRYLADLAPLTLVDNPLGFRAIEDYLGRVELGVYQ
ncbi:antitoxin Xre/MbcA/ParS toxin-binding domain-containing protein [Pseudomonas putida]